MKPIEIIGDARYILNDYQAGSLRQEDVELLVYVNAGINEVATHRPELFSAIGDLTCTVGSCEQAILFADAVGLVEVLGIHGGKALTKFDRRTMDQFRPAWRSDAAGEAQQWAPIEGDPLRFFIHPKAPDTPQVLDVRFIRKPSQYGLNDVIDCLPHSMRPALTDYTVYRAESKDDEHVLSQRAQSHYTAFLDKIGASNGRDTAQK